jgi:tetratricopeptide (TPR) repeat protein
MRQVRWPAILVATLMLSGCAKARPAVVPAPSRPAPPPEIVRLIEQGCYRCLEQALNLSMEHEAPDLAFESAALLALRSIELGMTAKPWLEQARALASGDSSWAMYLDIVSAIPPDPLNGARDEIFQETRARNRDRALVPLWHEALAAGPASVVFTRYLDLSLLCTIGQSTDLDGEVTGLVASLPDIPLLQYRAGICDSRYKEQLNATRERDSAFVDADYSLGRYALGGGEGQNQEEALRRFRSAAAAFPESPAIATTIGNLYQAWEEWPSALAAYDAAITLVPGHPDALIGRTISLSSLDRHQEAIESATRLIEGGRWFLGQAHYWRSWNYFTLGDYPTARTEADRTRTLMVNAAVFVLSGMIEWRLARPVNAEKEFEEAIAMDAGQCEAALLLGGVRSELAKVSQALAALQHARVCFDLSITVRRRAIDVLNAGPGTEATKAREVAKHQRAIARAEARRSEAEKAMDTLQKLERSKGKVGSQG